MALMIFKKKGNVEVERGQARVYLSINLEKGHKTKHSNLLMNVTMAITIKQLVKLKW
jgi:hypothetical protein